MSLTLASAARLLERHHLLREIIDGDTWTLRPERIAGADKPFAAITYDTRAIAPGTLLFCKGRFRPEYLDGADGKGLAAYVAETDLSERTGAPGLIVHDVRRAMALLAAEFHGRPQDQLTLVGITGTKGKTTTAYFTQAILSAHSGGRCALLSSVDNCVDGRTWVESELTTPESLDLFRLMRQAVDNGMKYLVMEVSSQAYKVERVAGLTFDVGAFLNISPDHISAIEHPTFEDYLDCKRRIVANSRTLVLGTDCAHGDLIREDAEDASVPVVAFAGPDTGTGMDADAETGETAAFTAAVIDERASRYHFAEHGRALADVELELEGGFNAANAAAAMAIARTAGVPADSAAFAAVGQVQISGRMERFQSGDITAYVDYAHNYASTRTLMEFVQRKYAGLNPRIIVVTGSVGDKAVDRREGIIRGVENGASRIILTQEDTVSELMLDICEEMRGYLSNPRVTCDIELDRAKAIAMAVDDAREHASADHPAVILVIGKGEERWIKIDGKHAPYEGDDHIVRRLLGLPQAS